MVKAFLTGGSGFVGKEFIRYLFSLPEASNYNVVAVSRSAKADEIIKAAAEGKQDRLQIVRGDLSTVSSLTTMMQECDVVFHLAAKAEAWGKWEDFLEANVRGTSNVIAAAKAAGVHKFIHISTEAVLLSGLENGCLKNVDETAPLSLNPSFYAPYTKSKAMAEEVVNAANSSTFHTVILRPRFVWGQGDTNVLPKVKEMAKRGQMKFFSPAVTSSTCNIENLCEGMYLASEKLLSIGDDLTAVAGQTFFLTDGESVPLNDFFIQMIRDKKITDKIGSLSSSFAWRLAIFVENLPFAGFGITREPPLSRQILGLMAQNVIVKDDKARRLLGYTSHISQKEGLERLYAWAAVNNAASSI